MNAPFPRRALTALAFALVLGAPALALGQDQGPTPPPAPGQQFHCPTCGAALPSTRCPTCGTPIHDPIDRRLDEVLRREYGDPNGPALPPRAEEPAPTVPPVRPRAHTSEGGPGDIWEDDFLKIRLGMSIDGGLSALLSSRIRGRHQPDAFEPGLNDDNGHRREGAFSLHGSTWLDLGRYFTVEMASSTSLARDNHRHQQGQQIQPATAQTTAFDPSDLTGLNGNTSNNGNTGNNGSSGGHHERELEFGTIDASLILHPVNCSFGRLDLLLGGRYLEAREGERRHMHSVEAGMPLIGVGGMIRPVHTDGGFAIELFARAEIGAMALGVPRDRNDRRDGWDQEAQNRSRYYAVSADAQGGIRFVFLDMFGVGAGARFEYADVEKRDSHTGIDKKIDWKSVGPFIALSMEM